MIQTADEKMAKSVESNIFQLSDALDASAKRLWSPISPPAITASPSPSRRGAQRQPPRWRIRNYLRSAPSGDRLVFLVERREIFLGALADDFLPPRLRRAPSWSTGSNRRELPGARGSGRAAASAGPRVALLTTRRGRPRCRGRASPLGASIPRRQDFEPPTPSATGSESSAGGHATEAVARAPRPPQLIDGSMADDRWPKPSGEAPESPRVSARPRLAEELERLCGSPEHQAWSRRSIPTYADPTQLLMTEDAGGGARSRSRTPQPRRRHPRGRGRWRPGSSSLSGGRRR